MQVSGCGDVRMCVCAGGAGQCSNQWCAQMDMDAGMSMQICQECGELLHSNNACKWVGCAETKRARAGG